MTTDATLIDLAKQLVNLSSMNGDSIRVEVDQRSACAWTVRLVGDSIEKYGFQPITTKILSAKCAGKTPAKAYARIEQVLRNRLAARSAA